MADDTTSSSTEATAVDDGTVTLVAPDGQEVTARNPVAINNLVYGRGYRIKDGTDPEAAVKAAADTAPPAEQGTAEPTGSQTEVTAVPAPAPPTPRAPATPKSPGKSAATGTPSNT